MHAVSWYLHYTYNLICSSKFSTPPRVTLKDVVPQNALSCSSSCSTFINSTHSSKAVDDFFHRELLEKQADSTLSMPTNLPSGIGVAYFMGTRTMMVQARKWR